jgi:hypothetical protein
MPHSMRNIRSCNIEILVGPTVALLGSFCVMRMGEGQSVRVILRHTFAHCDALDSALPGMLLHIDGSKHYWLNDDRWHDLVVILDDATSEIYYAQLVEEESTRTVMAALREVIETRVLFFIQ